MSNRLLLVALVALAVLPLQPRAWLFPPFDKTKFPGQVVSVYECLLSGSQLIPTPSNTSLTKTAGYARITTYVYSATNTLTVDFNIYLQSLKDKLENVTATIANADPYNIGPDVLTVPGKFKGKLGVARMSTRVANATYVATDFDPDLSVMWIMSQVDISPRMYYIYVTSKQNPLGVARGVLQKARSLI